MLVATPANDTAVKDVISLAHNTMMMASIIPDWPTIWPKRRNMITPRIVSTFGVNTPLKVPKSVRDEPASDGALDASLMAVANPL